LRGGTVEWKARVERGFRPNPIMGLRAAGAGSLGSSRLLHVFLTDSAEFRTLQRDAGHLQAALENLPEQFVLLLDADGCIRYAAGMERTLWYPIEECLGRDASFLFAQGAAGRDQLQALRRETAAGRRWEGEIWVVRKDGSRFPA